MSELTGKIAFVTGGSRGIGAAICRRLARAGAGVAFTYANAESHALALVAELEAMGRHAWALQVDSTDAAALAAAVYGVATRHGRLDVLVNSAGVFPSGPVDAVTLD